MDNVSCHHQLKDTQLTNIKLHYFPPNCTAHLQLCDGGVIYSLKCQYRRLLIQNRIKEYDNAVENGEPLSKIPKIDILQAINFIVTAWNNVSISTI